MIGDSLETIDCPVCEGKRFSNILTLRVRDFVDITKPHFNLEMINCTPDTEFSYVECRGCGFTFTNPRLTSAMNSVFYNEAKVELRANKKQDAKMALREFGTVSHMRKKLIAAPDVIAALVLSSKQLAKRKPDDPCLRLMDYGSGYGWVLDLARAFGMEAHGIEKTLDRLEFCRAKGFRVGERSEFEGELYDTVISQSVIEHVTDLNEYLSDISRLLKPGGLSIFVGLTPDIIKVEKRRGKYKNVHPISHLNMFDQNSLNRILKKHDMKILTRKNMLDRTAIGRVSKFDLLRLLVRGGFYERNGVLNAIVEKITP